MVRKTLFLAVLGATAPLAFAGGAEAGPKYTPKISIEKARSAALERVPGTVVEEELEREHGRWQYEFEIRPAGETGKRIKEVAVDPETGTVLAVDDEDEDGAEGDDNDRAGDDDDEAASRGGKTRAGSKARSGRKQQKR